MGHQGSSPLHHHHHHHHHHRHRGYHPATQTADHELTLSFGRLNRESHALSSQMAVESWLGEVTTPVPPRGLVSPESRNQSARYRKHPRPRDRLTCPCCQNPRRVDPSWRPQHIPPARGSSPLRLPSLTTYARNPKRHKRKSGDSSLISELSPRREFRRWSHIEIGPGLEGSPLDKLPDKKMVGTRDASSPMLHASKAPAFEKRPRHRTKEDKYDTKKSERVRSEIPDHNHHRLKKRKHKGTGKNVMNTFTSEAVINDRITVQPNMRPGLFGNKRTPRQQTVTDLSFSEMPFPMHQEREAQQKGLSSSRLRERRRESRELEQISSFFTPSRAEPTWCEVKLDRENKKVVENEKSVHGDNASTADQDSSAISAPLPGQTQHRRQQSFLSQENPCSVPSVTPSDIECRPGSSKTTYFAWSSSRHSHGGGEFPVGSQQKPPGTATPESIRRALIDTGVYTNTGINPYDSSNDKFEHDFETRNKPSSACCSVDGYKDNCKKKASAMDKKSTCSDDIMIPLTLERRWNKILPPQWNILRPTEAEKFPIEEQRGAMIPTVLTSGRPLGRQNLAQEARIKPTQDSILVQHAGDHSPSASARSAAKISVSVSPRPEQIVQHVDRDKIASRDAMPPPPIPQLSNMGPSDDIASLGRSGMARLPESYIQAPNCEFLSGIDTNKPASDLYQLSREPEGMIATLDSASWIPRAETSSITSYEREKTLSRLNIRSPIYGCLSGISEPRVNVRRTLPYGAHTDMKETMADFIRRIESELEQPTYSDEYCRLELRTENQEVPLELMTDTYGTWNRLMTFNESPMDHGRYRDGAGDLELEGVYGTDDDSHGCRRVVTSPGDISTAMPIEGPMGDIHEFLEMSNFWRPNRFSQT